MFIAVRVSAEAALTLNRRATELSERMPFKKWVHPQDYHITLQFLGDTPTGRIPAITQALQDVAKGRRPFQLETQQVGVFGSATSPRILWAGVGGDLNALVTLQQSVVSAMAPFGFEPEERPYRPHITLGRKYQGTDPFVMDIAGKDVVNIQWNVHAIELLQTNLHQTPMYETVGLARFF
ncbi:RNA 2',3'-cyclic phosphodiesterase [Paenibacillus sp. JCM 10914]|uniref:RNA 2',3'-cyclic phosphodiesterase n=1 Tax=Paenibacillus sp. JCM 10914 TaxID=1236974 RepID=UPI000A61C882|nr:RNA 2',3'-cyclic phosphodiesterase [Paenibacillus sp. JCM 10914]